VPGELRIKGASTLLTLHADEDLAGVVISPFIKGTTFSGDCISLLGCLSLGTQRQFFNGAATRYHAEVFPHHVAIGRNYLDPEQPCIKVIHFSTTDLNTLFYDFDAFSSVVNAKPLIDEVLNERRKIIPVEAGERPLIMYFTGKDCIAEVSTAIGKVSVHHRPSFNLGGPAGVFIKNQIVVSIEPLQPVTFENAVGAMYDMASFLSMAAGRAQAIDHIHVTTTEDVDKINRLFDIFPSYRWKLSDRGHKHKPHPGDVPLDPINRPTEYEAVLINWMSRHHGWHPARWRYMECLRKANSYDPARLVAAANMFDILPPDAVPLKMEMPSDLAATRDMCAEMFRKHPESIDRNSALDALGRLGNPSLPNKVAHRVAIVESVFGESLPDLQRVAGIAVRYRNFFVHGSSGGLDCTKLETFLPFLTDALEFVFAASDFIDAGWDAKRWNSSGGGFGHSFARFKQSYSHSLTELKSATSR
jgi:hypothetical protein